MNNKSLVHMGRFDTKKKQFPYDSKEKILITAKPFGDALSVNKR